MKLVTVAIGDKTNAARWDNDGYVLIDGYADVAELLNNPEWQRVAQAAETHPLDAEEVTLLRPIIAPSKIICVGLNYKSHILEMGRDLPKYPTLFAKFADTLTNPESGITAVAEDPKLDWEGELVVVIGREVRAVAEDEADAAIAGYTIANDISMRGWQFRTKEWLQGKIWQESTPVGPALVTADEVDEHTARLHTSINGETVQDHALSDLLFSAQQLVSYVSTITTLRPGDLILTGTPGGVGHAREPQRYLVAGDEVSVAIDGIGTLHNTIVEPR